MPAAVGLLDEHGQLGVPEVTVARVVPGDSTPPLVAHLDHVGAGPDELADLAGASPRPVDDRGAAARVGDEEDGTSAPQTSQSSPWPPVWLSIVIEISIRGPGTIPLAWAVLHAEVGAACFADRRDAGGERAPPCCSAAW